MGNCNLERHQLTVAEAHRNLAPSGARVGLVNTGWGGGAYGNPIFGFGVATECPSVPREILTPRSVWTHASPYDGAARTLADVFRENFKKYESGVSAEIKAAGPA
jgi:ATP-dependent phosphoenolpyruvate carboxykinase